MEFVKSNWKPKRENLFSTYHNDKSYIVSRSRTVSDFKGLINYIKLTKKRKKKNESNELVILKILFLD